nr:response regulator [uncultured Lichenicoccus sp.]
MKHGTARVLIAEDDEFIRLMLVEVLDGAGFDILEAKDGREALHLIDDLDDIDVLVSDINMPGSTGFEVAAHLREVHPGIPVILVSGRVDLLHKNSLTQPFRCLAKPFTLRSIVAAVQDMLDDSARRLQ